jgi:hypothetical protein
MMDQILHERRKEGRKDWCEGKKMQKEFEDSSSPTS